MKNNLKLLGGMAAAFLMAGLQAHATSLTFTENIPNINYEVAGQTYTGQFTDANLKSGSTVFNNSMETISSATIDLTMLYAAGNSIKLTVDGISQDLTFTGSPQTMAYTLSATQYNYIQAQDGTFNFAVTVDCELASAELIVNAGTGGAGGGNSSAPDGASTVMLLGGALTTLGLIRRKLS